MFKNERMKYERINVDVLNIDTTGMTHLVWMRISALVGFNINLQISSCVTGMAVLLDTQRSDR